MDDQSILVSNGPVTTCDTITSLSPNKNNAHILIGLMDCTSYSKNEVT